MDETKSAPKRKPPNEEELRRLIFERTGRTVRSPRIREDTSNFLQIEYDDILLLEDRIFLIKNCEREGRFGLDDEPKFWVRRALDLDDGEQRIIKMVFRESFESSAGGMLFQCVRSPRKEARVLEIVRGHKHFMQGITLRDVQDNPIRVLDVIWGESLSREIDLLECGHEEYYYEILPGLLREFTELVRAVRFLHGAGEKHGDIRRDHILRDRSTGLLRWIDFDYNIKHGENMYAYDLFGLGNVLVFLSGRGDVNLSDLKKNAPEEWSRIEPGDENVIFKNRLVNLKKVFPYVSESLNLILLHFSTGASLHYENADELIEDLEAALAQMD